VSEYRTESADRLSLDDLKFAIEDGRAYQAALTGQIYFAQGKATTLLAVYSSVGIAAASGAIAGVGGASSIPVAAAAALAAAAMSLLLGGGFCFLVLRRNMIAHAGREADLWLWALELGEPDVDHDGDPMRAACIGYLRDLQEANRINTEVIRRIDPAMVRARLCGIFAPLAAALGGLGALAIQAFV
jgi:hypothetical protein